MVFAAIRTEASQSGPSKSWLRASVLRRSDGDLSLENARLLARADIDYVYLRWSMDRWTLRDCIVSRWNDRKAAFSKRVMRSQRRRVRAVCSLRAKSKRNGLLKQALDIGLIGVIFKWHRQSGAGAPGSNETCATRRRDVKISRPAWIARLRTGKRRLWWGIPEAEYERRADLWPLNPDGDLLST